MFYRKKIPPYSEIVPMSHFDTINEIFLRNLRSFTIKHDKSDLLSKWIYRKLIDKKNYTFKKRTDL